MLILKELNRLLNDEDGLTMVEYAVAGALVAAGAAAAFSTLGTAVTTEVKELCGWVQSSGGKPSSTGC